MDQHEKTKESNEIDQYRVNFKACLVRNSSGLRLQPCLHVNQKQLFIGFEDTLLTEY